jgi:hypothetical protein
MQGRELPREKKGSWGVPTTHVLHERTSTYCYHTVIVIQRLCISKALCLVLVKC